MSESRILFLHIGLPKTGTTYLQHILRQNRAAAADVGLLYPGTAGDHFLPAQDVLQRPFRGHFDERASGTWATVANEVNDWSGNALISHEIFSAARSDQVPTVLQAFPHHRVEVVVTCRDLARQLPANWQETVKNGYRGTLSTYVERAKSGVDDPDPQSGFWLWQDLPRILRTWGTGVPPSQIHLVTVPPRGREDDLLWHRFADVIGLEGVDPKSIDTAENVSLGAVETEFLRRVNVQLDGALEWTEYRTHVKNLLARRVLSRAEQSGPIVLTAEDRAWVTAQCERMVEAASAADYCVHGDLDELLAQTGATESAEILDPAVRDVGVRAVTQLLRRIGQQTA